MTEIISLDKIKSILPTLDLVAAMEHGFIQYSNGNSVVPPVGELILEKGDTHIKYGYIKGDEFYVVKIASGFYANQELGISNSQGLMLLFSQLTGQTVAVLLDDGHLTDLRTAAAGALAAKYFAPKKVTGIGIVGTGIQARLQLDYLLKDYDCKTVWVWGRNIDHAKKFISDMKNDCEIHLANDCKELASHCNLIVTTTPSENPLLAAEDIRPGTHITAVGSDTADKQELDSEIFRMADIVIADSLPQSKSRGEIYQAVKHEAILADKVIELGTAIQDVTLQRTNDQQISIVDLTGVAVQDIMISSAVYQAYQNNQ